MEANFDVLATLQQRLQEKQAERESIQVKKEQDNISFHGL